MVEVNFPKFSIAKNGNMRTIREMDYLIRFKPRNARCVKDTLILWWTEWDYILNHYLKENKNSQLSTFCNILLFQILKIFGEKVHSKLFRMSVHYEPKKMSEIINFKYHTWMQQQQKNIKKHKHKKNIQRQNFKEKCIHFK